MDDLPAPGTAGVSLRLVEGAELIGVHRFVERELFGLTGRWSMEAATDPHTAAIAEFLAAQSAVHAWRLAEWEQRSPRSVEVPVGAGATGWSEALSAAEAAPSSMAKLACWCHVIAVGLSARYRRHRLLTAPVADAGIQRWLAIAESDVLDAMVSGEAVLGDATTRTATDSVEVGAAVARCLRPLLDSGS